MERQEMQADIVVTGFGPAAAGFLTTLAPELAKTKEDGTPLYYESQAMPGCPLQVMCYERADDTGFGVSGVVTKADFSPIAYERGYGMRAGEFRCFATVEVSIVDKDNGKVLQANRPYSAETTITVQGDLLTAKRNAVPRLANEFARQIVDAVLSYPYNRKQ